MARRFLLLSLVLGAEALIASVFLDGSTLTNRSGTLTGLIRNWGVWVVRFGIGFAALFTTFAYLKHRAALTSISRQAALTPIRRGLFAAHFPAIAIFGLLSAALYGSEPGRFPQDLVAAAWVAAGAIAVAFLVLALLPATLWMKLIHGTGKLWLYSSAASFAACYLGAKSWALWKPAVKLTFELVRLFLSPFVRDMIVQPAVNRIGTRRFTAIISPECSGLEGAALLLIFGVLWLILFRDEIRFPRALLLLPAGIVVLFLLNAVRIAALILIGHAGARDIAAGGFHSQAGWITFCTVAFGLSVAARRLPWLSVHPPGSQAEAMPHNPAAPYLLPFLAILAAGMISRAASGKFEWLYSLRLIAALSALWFFRRRYTNLDWRFGWRAPATGTLVFCIWIALERIAIAAPAASQMPAALSNASSGLRVSWIALRVLVAVAAVPVAEELAFRGFLLRRFIAADFEAVSFRTFTWFALLGSAVIFGLLHGRRWLAGAIAGAMFALVSLRSGRLGEAVIAHATANALLAAYVLFFDQWYAW